MQEHERIERWLIDGPAQQRTGPHAGAVAGWVGPDGRAEYVYPEITGYYLQWLAWIARRRGVHGALIARADAAQRWLVAWAATDDDPPTRRYLRCSPHDWRNDTVFVFDLAMVLRGLGSAHHVGLIAPNVALIRRLGDLCSALIGADGRFDACVRNRARTGPAAALVDTSRRISGQGGGRHQGRARRSAGQPPAFADRCGRANVHRELG